MASSFHDLKRQAALMFRDKINKARWAITSATPAQILIEEAINNEDTIALEGPTKKVISRAAFDVEDYYRIVDILHKRLNEFDKRKWRCSYKALIMLEHLLTHGPERVAEEFISDADSILKMEGFQLVDEKGINWGSNMKNKCLRIEKLIKEKPFLKDERARARKVTRAITAIESSHKKASVQGEEEFRRSNSHYTTSNNSYNYIKDEDHEPDEELHPFQDEKNHVNASLL